MFIHAAWQAHSDAVEIDDIVTPPPRSYPGKSRYNDGLQFEDGDGDGDKDIADSKTPDENAWLGTDTEMLDNKKQGRTDK